MTLISSAGPDPGLSSRLPRDGLRDLLHGLRWYAREVSGEAAYDRYVARHHREHPAEPPLDLRTWWRRRFDDREGEPPQRCC